MVYAYTNTAKHDLICNSKLAKGQRLLDSPEQTWLAWTWLCIFTPFLEAKFPACHEASTLSRHHALLGWITLSKEVPFHTRKMGFKTGQAERIFVTKELLLHTHTN